LDLNSPHEAALRFRKIPEADNQIKSTTRLKDSTGVENFFSNTIIQINITIGIFYEFFMRRRTH